MNVLAITPFKYLDFIIIIDVLKNIEHLSRKDIEDLFLKRKFFGLGVSLPNIKVWTELMARIRVKEFIRTCKHFNGYFHVISKYQNNFIIFQYILDVY